MRLVSSRDMRAIEAAANADGLSYAPMMDLAGTAVAHAADDWMVGKPGVIVILCGPGNNGGDGLIAASRLAELGHAIRVLTWKRAEDDPLVLAAVDHPEIGLVDGSERGALAMLAAWLEGADILLDALLGTGVSRPIRGRLAEILAVAMEAAEDPDGPAILAVDLPSGLNADSGAVDPLTLPADLTVTFGFAKAGQFTWPGAGFVGELILDDIGIPQELGQLSQFNLHAASAEAVAALLPELPLDAHKGMRGRVLLLAGSPSYPGAAALAAESAYRAGCGLVTLIGSPSLREALAARIPEVTWLALAEFHDLPSGSWPLAEAMAEIEKAWPAGGVVLAGPGLGQGPGSRDLLDALLLRALSADARLVIDADGLNLLAQRSDWPGLLPALSILTPHPGEMARLTGKSKEAVQADRLRVACEAAAIWGHVVVLKGALTVVAHPDGRAVIVPFANPGLATAGTGDVLAGLIAGLLAQGMDALDAAVVGAWVHGRAGEMAAEDLGSRSVLARDLLYRLAEVLQSLEEGWELGPGLR
jgi:NAD(P)H-hydrate epimerase